MRISPSQGFCLHTEQHEHGINAHKTDINAFSGFEPTIPAFDRAKTVHASDRAATVISTCSIRRRTFIEDKKYFE
jgi:hypothetical protein